MILSVGEGYQNQGWSDFLWDGSAHRPTCEPTVHFSFSRTKKSFCSCIWNLRV